MFEVEISEKELLDTREGIMAVTGTNRLQDDAYKVLVPFLRFHFGEGGIDHPNPTVEKIVCKNLQRYFVAEHLL